MYSLGAGRILIKSIIIVCLLNLMAWKASCAHRAGENEKKDNDKIKKKLVQTSSACGHIWVDVETWQCRKRPIFRQSIDTRKLSTQAPELLTCVRQNRFVIRQSGFRRRIVFDGNTLKENTANCVGFFQVLPQKTTLFESALCMPSSIVRILISMPISMYSSYPYVHKYVLGLHIL